jgi:hypothetical protein
MKKIKILGMSLIIFATLNSCSKDECEFIECTETNAINISTGIDANGNSIATSSVDPFWQITSSPNPSGTPALGETGLGVWEPSPVATTNATWINASGTCCSNLAGTYVFERDFVIIPGTTSFTCNFGIAYDDDIISLELVAPDSSVIPLTVTPTSAYQLSAPITDLINNPDSGTWKIRATINFIDSIAAFMISGNIEINEPCSD